MFIVFYWFEVFCIILIDFDVWCLDVGLGVLYCFCYRVSVLVTCVLGYYSSSVVGVSLICFGVVCLLLDLIAFFVIWIRVGCFDDL